MKMATDGEISKIKKEAVSTFEAELLSDSTIEAALKGFGWGSRMKKASIITQRAVMREIIRIAKEKMEK
ncbi:Uncharacterised protein [uncultured archaeon]|nr:Uncharacterised protein [uncultured archaeon]